MKPPKYQRTESFFKCKSSEYGSLEKGRIYHHMEIVKSLYKYPEDWQEVLPYPTSQELLDCIETGKDKTKIIRALKQWKKDR